MLQEAKINSRSRDTANRFVKANYPAELSLWASMLELALGDYVTGVTTNINSENYKSAKKWIFAEDQNYVNSFDSVCMLFNINSDKTRLALLSEPELIKARLTGKDKKKKEQE